MFPVDTLWNCPVPRVHLFLVPWETLHCYVDHDSVLDLQVSVSTWTQTNNPQKIWIFSFPQYIITQGNNSRSHWGRTVYSWCGVIGSFSFSCCSLGLRTGCALETGQRIVIFLWDSWPRPSAYIHPWFSLIIYIKQHPCWLSIYFAINNTCSFSHISRSLQSCEPPGRNQPECQLRQLCPSSFWWLSAATWPLSFCTVIIPIASRKPSSLTACPTVSPDLQKTDTNELLNNAALPIIRALEKNEFFSEPSR